MTNAQMYWYNRMMNVTARGFRPVAGDAEKIILEGWNEVEWTFDMDCPQLMKDLLTKYNPKPMYNVKSYNPKYNSVEWGFVSVWTDETHKTGYENWLNHNLKDATTIEFKFQEKINGVVRKEPWYFATAKKIS